MRPGEALDGLLARLAPCFSIRSSTPASRARRRGQGRDILDDEREQPLRRRECGRSRELPRSVPAPTRGSSSVTAAWWKRCTDRRPVRARDRGDRPHSRRPSVRDAGHGGSLAGTYPGATAQEGGRPRGVHIAWVKDQGLARRHHQRLVRCNLRRAGVKARGARCVLREPAKTDASGPWPARPVVRGPHAVGAEVRKASVTA